MATSDNLLLFQEDLISGLKGSRIILYPISVCLCELTMASFWHDSTFFQFLSLRSGRGKSREWKKGGKEKHKEETARGTRKRKTTFFFLLKTRTRHPDDNWLPQSTSGVCTSDWFWSYRSMTITRWKCCSSYLSSLCQPSSFSFFQSLNLLLGQAHISLGRLMSSLHHRFLSRLANLKVTMGTVAECGLF